MGKTHINVNSTDHNCLYRQSLRRNNDSRLLHRIVQLHFTIITICKWLLLCISLFCCSYVSALISISQHGSVITKVRVSRQPYTRTLHALSNSGDPIQHVDSDISISLDDSTVSDISSEERDNNVLWQLFCKHHARCSNKGLAESEKSIQTSWVGKWTTYDYVGDIVLETIPACVNYIYTTADSSSSNDVTSFDKVDVTHSISTGSTSSDCTTCFDDPTMMRTIPITSYTPNNISTKSRLGACGMVVGPSIMRSSGTMATELVLSHEQYRLRTVFQHAPVWSRGVEPGSCPPNGLKLIRCLVARETLATTADNNAEIQWSEIPLPGTGKHPTFDRSVPPFDWHKKWSGTSWTWGIEAGDRGWSIPELEIGVDDWHGCAPVEAWNLRLQGGIFIQLPRVVTGDATERCRLAWMPDADTLLRLEAGVTALQPILDSNDSLVGFEPPTLVSLRCDVLQNEGDLDGVPSFVQQQLDEQISEGN